MTKKKRKCNEKQFECQGNKQRDFRIHRFTFNHICLRWRSKLVWLERDCVKRSSLAYEPTRYKLSARIHHSPLYSFVDEIHRTERRLCCVNQTPLHKHNQRKSRESRTVFLTSIRWPFFCLDTLRISDRKKESARAIYWNHNSIIYEYTVPHNQIPKYGNQIISCL